MYVPDEIRRCVLFLGNKDVKTGKFYPRATAFVVSIHEGGVGFRFVVTAEHAIAGFAQKGWDIHVRSNLINGGVREDNWSKGHWSFHPDVGSSDVAVAPIDFHPDEEFLHILLRSDGSLGGSSGAIAATADVLTKEKIGLGDEVFVLGLFRSHYGLKRNIPIMRVGNLAMMRGKPVYTSWCGPTDAYLVETRSISGLSGSPVFVHVPVADPGGIRTRFFFLGLMHGHFDIKNLNEDAIIDSEDGGTGGINTGIGVVIPVEKILETIDQPELADMRKQAIKEHREKNGAKADFAADDAPEANDANPKHREDFTSLVSAAARKQPQGD